jgi:hypothetical protein
VTWLLARRIAILLAAVGLLLLIFDPRQVSHERLQGRAIEDHMTRRVCPDGQYKYPQSSIQTLPFGPYQLRYPADFLQIDAYRIHKRGDIEIVKGERKPMPVARTWVQIHALAPEMAPNFLADGSTRRREARGDLYLVEIELFWSEDGSREPTETETFGAFLPAEPLLAEAASSIGLVAFQKPGSSGSRKLRLVPTGLKGNGPQIFCYGYVEDRGRGRCSAVQRLRADVWARISFSSENIACWQQVEERVQRLVQDFTSDWKVQAR